MSNQKLCIDCKHWDGDKQFPKCKAPQNTYKEPNEVGTGMPIYRVDYCSSHRRVGTIEAWADNLCGRRGRWFELRDIEEKS